LIFAQESYRLPGFLWHRFFKWRPGLACTKVGPRCCGRLDLQAAEKPGGLRNTDTIITLALQQSTLLSCQEISYPPTKNLAQ